MNQKNILKTMAVLDRPFINSEAGFDKFKKAVAAEDSTALKDFANGYMHLHHKAFVGMELPEKVEKSLGIGGNPTMPQVASFFDWTNDLTVDVGWMASFDIVNAGVGVDGVQIMDWENNVTWSSLKDGEPIPFKPYGDEAYSVIREIRRGAALQFKKRWLETNNIHNINTGFKAIQMANMAHKAGIAYPILGFDNTGTFASQTITANTVDAFIVGLNAAAVTLLTRNASLGFGLSPSTPMNLHYPARQKGFIDRVKNAVSGITNGQGSLVSYNITFIPTFDATISTQLGGFDVGHLWIPGRKNIWLNTKPMAVNEKMDFDTATVKIAAEEYTNTNSVANTTGQHQIVDMEK